MTGLQNTSKVANIYKKLERLSTQRLIPVDDFNRWMDSVIELIVKKQKQPFANYRKSKWKVSGKVFMSMYKENYTPQKAANLWALNHAK